MHKWLNQKYLNQTTISHLKQTFPYQKPFPYFELNNFFKKGIAENLIKALQQESFYEKQSDLFQLKQTNDLISTNNKLLAKFRSLLISDEFITYMESVTGIKLKRNIIDLAGTLYQDTDYLLCHDDQLPGRKIAFIYYLSTLQEQDGGSLNLFGNKNKTPSMREKKLYPKANTLAFFKVSNISFHEVEEVITQKDRLALSGWFHG